MEITVNGKKRHYRTIWMENGIVKAINQPLLPHKFEISELQNYRETASGIKNMLMRGAGAIGAAAGYAYAQAVLGAPEQGFQEFMEKAEKEIKATRPTAIDLVHAVDRVKTGIRGMGKTEAEQKAAEIAQAIADEDVKAGEKIGENGAELLKDGSRVMTHCNAGWLAFVDWGTALSPVYKAKRQGKKVFVYASETRPRMQGSRLTAWELQQEGIDYRIIADNAGGYYLKKGEVDIVFVGADRIASNGDVANKIGTYMKAVAAKENGIPFYVCAPLSTIDTSIDSGKEIPIEERDEKEVLEMWGKGSGGGIETIRVSPEGGKAFNPAFDVTPAKYVTGIVTEKGIVKANNKGIAKLFG